MGRAVRFVLIGLVWAGGVQAQAVAGKGDVKITGQVFAEDGTRPMEFVNIVLYSLPESAQVAGTVTDSYGRFTLLGVKPARYYLEISFIGYETKRVENIECAPGAQIDLGRLTLKLSSVPVSGVEVIGDKPAISQEVDKKVIDVTKLPSTAGGTAVDALKNVPGVKVDIEGNVTLRGSSNFTVLIDGRPSGLEPNQALKQIPAVMIERIEIITNPSAKYEPEGTAGIINIILKKQKGQGLSALVNANAGFKNRYGGDALVGLRSGIINTYFGGNIWHSSSDNEYESETRTFGSADTLKIASSGSSSWDGTSAGARAGLELQLGPRDKSSIVGRLGNYDGRSTSRERVTEHHLLADSSRDYQNDRSWRFGSKYLFLMADHEHQFDTAGHKLTAQVYLVGRQGLAAAGNTERDSTGATITGRRSQDEGPTGWIRGEAEYTLPTGDGGKLEAGFQSRVEMTGMESQIYRFNPNTDTWELDSLSSHPYLSRENIHSLYTTYSWRWQKLAIQPGLRGEYGSRIIHIQEMDSIWQLSRWDYFPSLHFSYNLPANFQVSASYSRRIDRPYYWYLRPLPVWYDAHSVSKGNPMLRPSYVNSYEVGFELPFGANLLSLEAYCRTTSNMFEWITTRYPGDTNALLQTAANIGSDRSLGVEFSAHLSPVKWLNAYITGDIADYHEWGTLFNQEIDRRSISWSGSLNLNLQFPSATQVQLNGNLSGPYITATSTSDGWFGTDLAVKQSLFNRTLSITLRCQNLFGPRTWKSREDGQGFRRNYSYIREGLRLSLAVSYNFNNFRFDPKMRAGEGIEQEGTGVMPRR